MNDVDFMDEMDNPSNMKTVTSKLPFKMREQWRHKAYENQTRTKRKARFTDLMDQLASKSQQ